MDRPLLLDTYCGAGGCSVGYHRAGLDVVGIDNNPKPLKHYPFPWACMDALEALRLLIDGKGITFSDGREYHLSDFAAIHASPPCQFYSRLRHLPWLKDRTYWRSIPPTREMLVLTGKPYVLENVEDAAWDMLYPQTLCGYSLGLPIFRHRIFEFPEQFMILCPSHKPHDRIIASGRASLSKRHEGQGGFKEISRDSTVGHAANPDARRVNMGIDWMNRDELSQAIPPVYCQFIGKQLMKVLAHQEGR